MLGNALAPYEDLMIDGAITIRYCPDASEAFRTATGRPLAHLKILLDIPREDGPGHVQVGADHFYDPPAFRSIAEAGLAVLTWMQARYGPDNPTNFPRMRELSPVSGVKAPDTAL